AASPARSATNGLSRGRWFRSAPALRLAAQDRVHLIAFESRHRFGNRDVGQFFNEPFQDATADLGMRHFASAEENRRLDLVAFFEEALDVLLLELVVVLVDLRAELDLFDQAHVLVRLCLTPTLLFLILVLPEVHDAANRRVWRW